MEQIIFINIILLMVIIALFIVLSWLWPPDSPWAPWWRTNRKTARRMCGLAKITEKDVVYDLGSGDGTALIVAAKEFGAKGVGIEIDPLRVSLSSLLLCSNGVQGKVKIKRNNFFKEDISKATVVFLYLVPKALLGLKPKLLKELKPGTRIVTVTYKIPGGLSHKKGSEKETQSIGIKRSLGIAQKDTRELFLYVVPNRQLKIKSI